MTRNNVPACNENLKAPSTRTAPQLDTPPLNISTREISAYTRGRHPLRAAATTSARRLRLWYLRAWYEKKNKKKLVKCQLAINTRFNFVLKK